MLVSARQKLARAGDHLADLTVAVSEYLKPLKLYRRSPAGDKIEFRMGLLPPIPDGLSLLFGDFLQNARASLDHAVYELSTQAEPDFERTGFPIVLEAERFDPEATRLMPHVGDPARQVIRNFQPFAWGAGEYDYLLSLHRLAIVDRHRTVTLTAAVVEPTGVGWHRTKPRDDNPEITFYRPGVAAGDVLLTIPSRATEPTASFSPRFEGRVAIGRPNRFADLPAVDEQARGIHERIETLFAYLEQAIRGS